MLGIVDKLYHKKVSARGISIFRIFFSLTLLLEVLRIFRFKELYFDPIPFIQSSDSDFTFLLITWSIVLLFLICGFLTKIAAFANYFLAVYILTSIGAFEYHMDYAYIGISFLMIILPLSRYYSLDLLFFKQKGGRMFNYLRIKNVSVLYYYLPLLVGIAFVYLGSIPFKLKSEMWMNGLGVWLPASLPQITILNDQWLLNQKILIKSFGYITLLFEIVFPFLFFIKKTRCPLFVIGMVLHIGILLEFPIPFFALGVMSIYILLVPIGAWSFLEKKLMNSFLKKSIKENVIYQSKHAVWPKHFARYKITGFKILFLILCLFQLNVMFNFPFSDLISKSISKENWKTLTIFKEGKKIKKDLAEVSSKYLGITVHGVFIDEHFDKHETLFTLSYKNELLPLYDELGMPDKYLQGGSWINFNFRVNGPDKDINDDEVKEGLKRYSSFWAHKNCVLLDDNQFKILSKKIRVSFQWEKNLLLQNSQSSWEEIGILKWEDKKGTIILEDLK